MNRRGGVMSSHGSFGLFGKGLPSGPRAGLPGAAGAAGAAATGTVDSAVGPGVSLGEITAGAAGASVLLSAMAPLGGSAGRMSRQNSALGCRLPFNLFKPALPDPQAAAGRCEGD